MLWIQQQINHVFELVFFLYNRGSKYRISGLKSMSNGVFSFLLSRILSKSLVFMLHQHTLQNDILADNSFIAADI